GGSSGDGGGSGGDTVEGGSGSSSGIDESDADLGSDDINMVSGSSDSGAPGLWIDATGSRIWIEGAFSPEAAEAVRDGLIEAVERGTGREAKMEGVRLAGKTGTAEIKQSKDDVTGTELGWFVLLTADTDASHPLLIAAMVEDVRGRGGSSYVVPKVSSAFRAVLYL
ncbi:MAG: penicillin-binding transpeptidase domain-containing protein, partial [Oscillospiraceae bacterium]|nr:penicillin-binding transpeptidase domain-containing protein [Oscillospiraceae bacterium]